MTGSDWRSYEKWYYWVDIQYSLNSIYGKEPGYFLYQSLFKLLKFDFWSFLIITKIITFSVVNIFINKYIRREHYYLFWIYYLPWFGFFLFIDNPLRSMISMTIFLLSWEYLKRGNFKYYLLFTVFASLFHVTAIIMLPIYFIAHSKVPSRVWVFVFIIVNIIGANQFFLKKFIILFNNLGISRINTLISWYIFEGGYDTGSLFSFGTIFNVIVFIIIIMNRKKLENYKDYGSVLFNLTVLYTILYRFGLTWQVLTRLQLLLSVVFVVTLISIYSVIQIRYKNLYIAFLVIVSLIAIKGVYSVKYIPYTNYIPYFLKNDFPSYDYRDSYNRIKSQTDKY